jgi:hypothetical protein
VKVSATSRRGSTSREPHWRDGLILRTAVYETAARCSVLFISFAGGLLAVCWRFCWQMPSIHFKQSAISDSGDCISGEGVLATSIAGRGASAIASPCAHHLSHDGKLTDVIGVVVRNEQEFAQNSLSGSPGNARMQINLRVQSNGLQRLHVALE